MSTCPRCSRQMSDDYYACRECAREAVRDLQETARFLWVIDAKRARVSSRLWIGRGSVSAEKPLPYDSRVRPVLMPVTTSLVGWARVSSDEHFDHAPPPANVAILPLWLAEHTEWATTRPWANDAFEDYARCVASLRGLFDIPPEREAIGECGAELGETYCREVLAAEKGAAHHTCPKCGATHDVVERRDELIAQADELSFTTAEIVNLLRTNGADVTRRLLQATIRHFQIVPTGFRQVTDIRGRSRREDVYRLGAVRDGLAQFDNDVETRRSIKRQMRGGRDLGDATLSASG